LVTLFATLRGGQSLFNLIVLHPKPLQIRELAILGNLYWGSIRAPFEIVPPFLNWMQF
jgi:hypothetical protein